MTRARNFIARHKLFFNAFAIAIGVLAAAVALLAFVWHGFSQFDAKDYETNLYTEGFGVFLSVFISVVIIGGWSYWRERQQLRARLKREAGSRSFDIAIAAVEWLDDKNWLIGDKGVLKGAKLDNANLQGAWLEQANLQGAWLYQANLQKAQLAFAQMQYALLQDANLQNAKLMNADLRNAYLFGANMQDARLMDSDMRGAEMQKVDLQNAWLYGADMQDVELQNANLLGARLHEARLHGAILPDGQPYTESIDLEKYTYPGHPDYHDYSETLRKERNLRNIF